VEVTPEEIRSERTTIAPPPNEFQAELEDLIGERVHELVNRGEINDLIANTNAVGWGLDVYDINNGRFDKGKFIAEVEFSICGDQEDDKPWHGTTISGCCRVIVDKNKNVRFTQIEASLEDESDEPGEEYTVTDKPPAKPPSEPEDNTFGMVDPE
jgi:hypothetical protein